MSTTFLDQDELCALTGRARRALQIQALKNMGIPFFVNGVGRPVVTRSAIEGKATAQPEKKGWTPRVLKSG